MKRIFRILVFAVLLSVLCAVFFACGKGNKTDSSGTDDPVTDVPDINQSGSAWLTDCFVFAENPIVSGEDTIV